MITIDKVILWGDPMPWSLVVMAATWSKWSHVVFELSDGTIMDANVMSGVSIHGYTPRSYRWTREFDLRKSFTDDQRREMYLRGTTQMTCPYDWSWIVGYAANQRDWQEEDSWVCFEYVAWTLMPWIEPEKNLSRITGRHLERQLERGL